MDDDDDWDDDVWDEIEHALDGYENDMKEFYKNINERKSAGYTTSPIPGFQAHAVLKSMDDSDGDSDDDGPDVWDELETMFVGYENEINEFYKILNERKSSVENK